MAASLGEMLMTARVTTLKGSDAGAYYVEALPAYYLDATEPRGRWHGRGADALGLRGEVADNDFLDLMAGTRPGSNGMLLGRRYGESSVRGFDITANAPKSVSVLFAIGDDRLRHETLGAHDAAVTAMVRWIENRAHTRFRIQGNVAVVDAEGVIAATFRQHTSRALDPAPAHPCRSRQPRPLLRRTVARPRRPHTQTRSAHPLCHLPRHPAR